MQICHKTTQNSFADNYGIEVMQHHGSHKKYTEAIQTRIKKWMDDNKNYTPEDAKDFVEELTTEFRDEIFEYKKLK